MLLLEKLHPYHLILASQSPRRRELLTGCGLDYELAAPYPCAEIYPADLPAPEVPRYLSALKSRHYPRPLAPRDILITADTVVIANNRILGKPADPDDARQMLQTLSATTHTVITGVTLRTPQTIRTFSVQSNVTFRPLTAEEIDFYLDNYRPYDKAGAYGIQEWIGYVAIESINGSFYNVMGLPVQRLYVELGKLVRETGF